MFKKFPQGMLTGSLLFLLLLVVSGCASNANATAQQLSPTNEINVSLTTYLITMSQDSAMPGKVTFHVKNNAREIIHEFVVFKTDLDPADMPTDAAGHIEEDKLQKVDEVTVDPLQEGDLVAQMDAGKYVVVCNQPGHYAQGMYLSFTVK